MSSWWWAGISGVDFERAWNNRVQGELDGLSVAFIGFDELLENKPASGRAKIWGMSRS